MTSSSTKSLTSFPLHSHSHLLIGRYSGFIRRVVLTELQSFTIQINECYTKKKGGEELESLTALALAAANLSETESTVGIAAAVAANVGRDQFHVLVHGEVSSWRACGTLTLPFSGIIHSDVEGRMHLSISPADINIMTAPFLQRSFMQSLAQCTFNIEWIRSEKDRGLIVMRGETEYEQYQCQREVEKIDFGESEGDIASDSAGSGTYTINNRSHQQSSLIQSSVSTFALICRYLNVTDLISVYQTSQHLSDAACHPIAHQTSNEVTVEQTFDECRSYLINGGQTCTFTKVSKMRQAFFTRLLRHMKSIKLDPYTLSSSEQRLDPNNDVRLSNWLTLFLLPSAPSLRSLWIEFPLMNMNQSVELGSTLTQINFMSGRCFQYLRLLRLTLLLPIAEVFCSHLPLSVEVLHLMFVPQLGNLGVTVPNSLVTYLKMKKQAKRNQLLTSVSVSRESQLSRLVFDLQNGVGSGWFTLLDVSRLSELHALEVLEEIYWHVPVDLIQMNTANLDGVCSLNLITSLRMSVLSCDVQGNVDNIQFLSHFPRLHSLFIGEFVHRRHEIVPLHPTMQIAPSHPSMKWPLHLQHSLKHVDVRKLTHLSIDVTISALVVAKLSHLQQLALHSSTSVTLDLSMRPLFASVPQLTELTLTNIIMMTNDILSFQLLPHLTSLREFAWLRSFSKSSPQFRGEYAPIDQTPGIAEFDHVFPSLTTLQIVRHDNEFMPYELLRQLSPRLRHFQWLNEGWINSSELIQSRWHQEELKLAPIYESRRANEVSAIVQLTLNLMVDKIEMATFVASFTDVTVPDFTVPSFSNVLATSFNPSTFSSSSFQFGNSPTSTGAFTFKPNRSGRK